MTTVQSKNLQNNLEKILIAKRVVKIGFHQMKKINNHLNKYSNHNFKPLRNQIVQNFNHQFQRTDKLIFRYKQKLQTMMKLQLA